MIMLEHEVTIEPDKLPIIATISILILILCINVSVAKNLYVFSKKYKVEHGSFLLFIHPILMIPLGLIFGIFIAILVSFLVANDSKKELSK